METEAIGSKYDVGQVWSYKARLADIGSTFLVVKIDPHSVLGNIIHISVLNLNMQNPHVPDGLTREFPHLPMSEAAIDNSVVKLLNEHADLPDYGEGYAVWKEAFDAGEAGIFTLTLAECIDVIEQSLLGQTEI